MRRLKKILLATLISAFALICGLLAISCSEKESLGGFSLDKKKVTVRVGEEAAIVRVLIDGEEYLVDISESDRAEVENVSGSITPIIENGRLINFEQFKEGIEPDDNFSL